MGFARPLTLRSGPRSRVRAAIRGRPPGSIKRGRNSKTEAVTPSAPWKLLSCQESTHDPCYALIGDPAKAKKQLGWEPKVKFKELMKIMTEADLELAKREAQIGSLLSS